MMREKLERCGIIMGDEPAFSMGMGIRALTIIPEQR